MSDITHTKEVTENDLTIVVNDNNDNDDKGKYHNDSYVSKLAKYIGVELAEDSEQPPKISLIGIIKKKHQYHNTYNNQMLS